MKTQKPSYLDAAYNEAVRAEKLDEVPVGCVIVSEGKIIARAHNLRETRQSAVAHAEVLAVIRACKKLGSWRLENCDVYVTLEPCPMCAAALNQARVRAVFYGAADPKGGAVSLGYDLHSNTRLNHRYALEMKSDSRCGQILTNFFSKKRSRRI